MSLNNKPTVFLQDVQPLYVLARTSGYCWETLKRYQIHDLEMAQTIHDPCLFFKKKDCELIGLLGISFEGMLGTGSEEFAIVEKPNYSIFDAKYRGKEYPFLFRGSTITKFNRKFSLMQQYYRNTVAKLSRKDFTPQEFTYLRSQSAYVATSTRSDVSYINAKLVQVVLSVATEAEVRLLNSTVLTL